MKRLDKGLVIIYWLCWLVILLDTNYTALALFLIAYHWLIPSLRRVILGRPAIYSRLYRIKINGGNHTQFEWERLQARFNWRCVKCQERKPLTKDHIIPISRGGTNNISNIQPLCRECNSSKGKKIVDYR